VDVLSASRGDVYAFTHALMFLTGFGSSSTRLPRPGGALAAEAEALLGWCLDEQDYDLGAEVLLTWPLLRRPWSAGATFGFMVLMRIEDEASFLPAPTTRLERYQALEGEERSKYALATAYHTAYVMGLLCAIALQSPGSVPPAEVPVSRYRVKGAATAILEILDKDSRESHWRKYISMLTEGQQDAVTPLLFSLGLRRAMAVRNLGEMQTILRLGGRYGLLTTVAAEQAVELLARAASLKLQETIAVSS
jgi:hypothetical protein